MNPVSSRFETVARVLPQTQASALPETLNERISALYTSSQKSNYVFGSPLGPFYHLSRHYDLPRFVYFGPHTHDASLRLAFLTGFDSSDLRAPLALANFVEQLARTPELGQGLNLSFFPMIDVLGLALVSPGRSLAEANWTHGDFPELNVLGKDARGRGYHGFIRLETSDETEAISVRLRAHSDDASSVDGIALISSQDFEPWSVKWETDSNQVRPSDGPLSLADDLPLQAFELRIRFPRSWSAELYVEAVGTILKRFVLRQRSLQAYRQNL